MTRASLRQSLTAAASSIVLELAASAVYLYREGYKDCWEEVRRRKQSKATPERMEQTQDLLRKLKLP